LRTETANDWVPSILLISQDLDLSEILSEQIERQLGAAVSTVLSEDAAQERIRHAAFDIILIDEAIEENGIRDFCDSLYRSNQVHSIILLTSAAPDSRITVPSESVVDGHIRKPFKLASLIVLIKSRLNRFSVTHTPTFQIGRFDYFASRWVLVERSTNQIIRLTEKEAEILQYLAKFSRAVVSRDELLIEVWGYNSGVTTHTVETHIYRLRQKLEVDPTNAQCLVTAPGGYQLINS